MSCTMRPFANAEVPVARPPATRRFASHDLQDAVPRWLHGDTWGRSIAMGGSPKTLDGFGGWDNPNLKWMMVPGVALICGRPTWRTRFWPWKSWDFAGEHWGFDEEIRFRCKRERIYTSKKWWGCKYIPTRRGFHLPNIFYLTLLQKELKYQDLFKGNTWRCIEL